MKLRETISWLKGRLQDNLFPHLRECCSDPLTQIQKDLVTTLEIVEILVREDDAALHGVGLEPLAASDDQQGC